MVRNPVWYQSSARRLASLAAAARRDWSICSTSVSSSNKLVILASSVAISVRRVVSLSWSPRAIAARASENRTRATPARFAAEVEAGLANALLRISIKPEAWATDRPCQSFKSAALARLVGLKTAVPAASRKTSPDTGGSLINMARNPFAYSWRLPREMPSVN
jgi:hypothetical protein